MFWRKHKTLEGENRGIDDHGGISRSEFVSSIIKTGSQFWKKPCTIPSYIMIDNYKEWTESIAVNIFVSMIPIGLTL